MHVNIVLPCSRSNVGCFLMTLLSLSQRPEIEKKRLNQVCLISKDQYSAILGSSCLPLSYFPLIFLS